MKKEKVEELIKLGFTRNPDIIPSILHCRVIHNLASCGTDSSYIVLEFDDLIGQYEDKKMVINFIGSVLNKRVQKRELDEPVDLPSDFKFVGYWDGNENQHSWMQFAFSDLLTKEEAVNIMIELMDSLISKFSDKTIQKYQTEVQEKIITIFKYLRIIKIFVSEQPVIYLYIEEDYDPFD